MRFWVQALGFVFSRRSFQISKKIYINICLNISFFFSFFCLQKSVKCERCNVNKSLSASELVKQINHSER